MRPVPEVPQHPLGTKWDFGTQKLKSWNSSTSARCRCRVVYGLAVLVSETNPPMMLASCFGRSKSFSDSKCHSVSRNDSQSTLVWRNLAQRPATSGNPKFSAIMTKIMVFRPRSVRLAMSRAPRGPKHHLDFDRNDVECFLQQANLHR